MATEFSEIYDNFMMKQTDYKLIALFNASQTDFETYLSSFLLDAIVEFSTICDQSLAYSDSAFTETLTQKNIRLLALLMTRYWLKKENDDLRQMQLHVQDKDFRVFSEANHMREKQAKYNTLLEELSQEMTNYQLNNTVDWSEWIDNQTFWES